MSTCASYLKPEEREFVVDSGASMHMISKKDLNSAEMDTLTKSCSPTKVITANGEVQTHEEATVYVKEFDIFLTMRVIENTPAVLSLGKLCDENGYSYEWINGQKPHLIKNGIRLFATRRTSFRSWFQACHRVLPPVLILQLQWHLQDRSVIILHLPQARLLHQPQLCQATVRLDQKKIRVGLIPIQYLCQVNMLNGKNAETRCPSQPKIPNQKHEDHHQERGDPCHSEIPEWLQEFRENLVDDRVPEHRDSHASSSHGSSLEPTRSADWVSTVFILISLKTEIAVNGPKLQVPRAEDAMAEPYLLQKTLVI